ncbi:hypothetical protein [uncultured Thiohalocapsa sp.]|uniref:hypothetical protein n=1 Tax=uncultured Thiohalocapsa sp. TaxID=768990 RepID=UPI0025E99004|nr:hypothetical protein [uncultured Thiohalocapsa sp.]
MLEMVFIFPHPAPPHADAPMTRKRLSIGSRSCRELRRRILTATGFPRSHRCVLAERVQRRALDCHGLIAAALQRRGRAPRRSKGATDPS